MKVRCRCLCHTNPAVKHIKACCVNGWVEIPDFTAGPGTVASETNVPSMSPSEPPTTEQTELWKEVLSYTAEQHSKIAIEISDQKWNAATAIVDAMYKFLVERYSITRKQEVLAPDWQTAFLKEPVTFLLVNALKYLTDEQLIALKNALVERTPKQEVPEAVEFKDWCEKNESALCFQEQRTLSTVELYAEFQLFKKRS